MKPPPAPVESREQRLDEAVLAYFKAHEAGQPPGTQEWLARWPDLADELRRFLADQECVEGRGAPGRALARGAGRRRWGRWRRAAAGPTPWPGPGRRQRRSRRRRPRAARRGSSSATMSCLRKSARAGWGWCTGPARRA